MNHQEFESAVAMQNKLRDLRAMTRVARMRAIGSERRIADELHLFKCGHVPAWRAGPGIRFCAECGLVEERPGR